MTVVNKKAAYSRRQSPGVSRATKNAKRGLFLIKNHRGVQKQYENNAKSDIPEAHTATSDADPVPTKQYSVFVRNLPYSTTSEDLRVLISHTVIPRHIIIVKDKQGNSRGFGFVVFTKLEDAEAAVNKFHNFVYQERPLLVELACDQKGSSYKVATRYKQFTACTSISEMKLEQCILMESSPSLPLDLQDASRVMTCLLPKFLRIMKVYSVTEHTSWLFQFAKPIEAVSVSRAWSTVCIPLNAIDLLIPERLRQSDTLEFQLKISSFEDTVFQTQITKPTTNASLIVRNLSFEANQQQIKKLLGSYGVLRRLRLAPCKKATDSPTNPPSSHGGFAFVTYKNREDAQKAMEALNQFLFFKRKLSVSWSLEKEAYESVKQEVLNIPQPNIRKLSSVFSGTYQRVDDRDVLSEDTVSISEKEYDIEDFTQERIKAREAALALLTTAPSEPRDATAKSCVESPHIKSKANGAAEAESNSTANENQQNETKHSKKEKRNLPEDVQEGKTVHVRGLPLDVTEDELREALKRFGDIVYVRLVKRNKERLITTAFVKFRTQKAVEHLMQEESSLMSCLGGFGSTMDGFKQHLLNTRQLVDFKFLVASCFFWHVVLDKQHPQALFTVLSDMPFERMGVVIRRKRLRFAVAVNKNEAEALEATKLEKNKLRKNAHLADIGFLDDNALASTNTSKADIRRRLEARKENNIKLSNPNTIVNPLRLCIRNLPPRVTKLDLQSLLIDYLTENPTCQRLLMEEDSVRGSKSHRRRIAEKAIQHLMLCCDTERKSSGAARSRGFAFVTVKSHDLALCLLHYLNNNPTVFGASRRPMVGFAIEDKRALRHHELRAASREQQHTLKGSSKKRTYSRGQRQREKKRLKQQQNQENTGAFTP